MKNEKKPKHETQGSPNALDLAIKPPLLDNTNIVPKTMSKTHSLENNDACRGIGFWTRFIPELIIKFVKCRVQKTNFFLRARRLESIYVARDSKT